jgi:hypothetical protein
MYRQRFKAEFGFDLPRVSEKSANSIGVPVLLNTWLAESLFLAKHRKNSRMTAELSLSAVDSETHVFRLMQFDVSSWYRPLSSWQGNSAVIWNEIEIEQWIDIKFASFQGIGAMWSKHERIQFWGMCAVYFYGGVFVDHNIRSRTALPIFKAAFGQDRFWHQLNEDGSLHYLASTPKHPKLECILDEILTRRNERGANSIAWSHVTQLLQLHIWAGFDKYKPACCPIVYEQRNWSLSSTSKQDFLPVNEEMVVAPSALVKRFDVSVQEQPSTRSVIGIPKEPWSKVLNDNQCSPGWLCNRCLRFPWFGSFSNCKSVCRSCYTDQICAANDIDLTDEIVVEVIVRERPGNHTNRIPRIIHQTWFEELHTARYPHLQRLQNSWKASGWDYRFYTDEDARMFIQKNFAKRFTSAYDAIIPGAFKADFFRLLVLLKYGGIYSDFDVQLDTNLDFFVTKDLSFFVPRDVAIDHWAGGNYCVWNGLIGAAPGHPIVAQAVEDILNRISRREDYLDIESSLCRGNLDAEIWKLRSFPILLVTGPCALGISLNKVLGHHNLVNEILPGWMIFSQHMTEDKAEMSDNWGDILILHTDRHDLGELRFSDLGRNLLVASSNQDYFARSAVLFEADPQKMPQHYSKSESDIVGSTATYKDDKVSKERVVVKVTFTVR